MKNRKMSKGHEQVIPRKRKAMAVKYMKRSTSLIMKEIQTKTMGNDCPFLRLAQIRKLAQCWLECEGTFS